MMLVFELPYPPSVNHYWRHWGTKTLISRGGRAFRKEVCAILAAHAVRPLSGPLAIDIAAHPPDRRQRDIDNIQKPLLDALQHGGAFVDDSQVVKLAIEKRPPIPGGKTIVRIRKV